MGRISQAGRGRSGPAALIRNLASVGLVPSWEMVEDGVRQVALKQEWGPASGRRSPEPPAGEGGGF